MPKIIVIGASAGGFEAIKTLIAALPRNLPASIFIVWHMSADVRGILPHVLNKLDTLPAANAIDGEIIVTGRIYVAPPDRHLLIENNVVRITRGPKENMFRPAVDPLFRSAADAYGREVIGIILSGALDDGTAGLWAVKHHGGITIVQDPLDAAVPSMPQNALRAVAVDYTLPVAAMPALLKELCNTVVKASSPMNRITTMGEKNKQTEWEIRIAKGELADMQLLGKPSPFACPECHGVLFTLHDGLLKSYRCHTGHAYSPDSLLAAITESIDEDLWKVIRGIEETIILLNHMGDHYAESNDTAHAAMYFKKANDCTERLQLLKNVVANTELLSHQRIVEDLEIDK